jgi:hypothetical protein
MLQDAPLIAVRAAVILLQTEVFPEIKVEDQPDGVTIFGNIAQSGLNALANGCGRDIVALQQDSAAFYGMRPAIASAISTWPLPDTPLWQGFHPHVR